MTEHLIADANDRTIATSATGLLRRFNHAGVILPADIHIAHHLSAIIDAGDEHLELLIALTVRAVRAGSACLNLDTLPSGPSDPLTREWDIDADAWPARDWHSYAATSPHVHGEDAPLVLDGNRLYLRLYWDEESLVLNEIAARVDVAPVVATSDVESSLEKYFPGEDSLDQRAAARLAATSRLAIITGGPGSGKTTTVSRLLGVLLDGDADLRIGLAAPTGKAAARMVEAIAEATRNPTFPTTHAKKIAELEASTIHRLLGFSPNGGYRHSRDNPLPFDVVIIDETSMVSLPLMARLLEAVSHDTALIFVGDPHQLASVEVGAVFTDLVDGLRADEPSPVAELARIRRFGSEIAELAAATNAGRASEVTTLLASAKIDPPIGYIDSDELIVEILPLLREIRAAASAGDAARALQLQASVQVLCAHRDGPYGANTWNQAIGRAVYGAKEFHYSPWHAGQPIMVTRNDYTLDLFNGDAGVVVIRDERLVAAFEVAGGIRYVPMTQLGDVIPAYAVTVHRAQGSQFDDVYVLLPEETSRILTRELFYTAITRARSMVRVAGAPSVVEAAINRRVERASGLGVRLVNRIC